MPEVMLALGPLTAAVLLAVANSKIVDYVFRPLRLKFPQVDFWWVIYVALVTGAVIGWISEVNIYAEYVPDETTARILTAITIGGGSSLIHEIFGKPGK